MPERIKYDIPKHLCKFAPRKDTNKEPIKIYKDKHKPRATEDKIFTKRALGRDKATFVEFIVNIYTEKEADKLEEFVDFLHTMDTCLYCKKKIDICRTYSNDNDEIVIPCDNCLLNDVNGTDISKNYVKWFNSDILNNYGLSYKDGFPKAIKAEWGTKCPACGGSHDGGATYFDFSPSSS